MGSLLLYLYKKSMVPPSSGPDKVRSVEMAKQNNKKNDSKRSKRQVKRLGADFTRAKRQRTARQETTMAKMGTLPDYLYSDTVDTIARTTPIFLFINLKKQIPNCVIMVVLCRHQSLRLEDVWEIFRRTGASHYHTILKVNSSIKKIK